MEPLTKDECRVLGVLIEKHMTTPDQYPLTMNAIVAGGSQKSNRSPVYDLSDDRAFDAAEGLRAKGLASRVEQSGARVSKYKHLGHEKLECRPAELALLAELLVRGPQTLGELRTRASRMQPFESTEAVAGFLRSMGEKATPLVKRLPPTPGTRAEKYAHLLAGDVAGDDGGDSATEAGEVAVEVAGADPAEVVALTARVTALEAETAALRAAIRKLANEAGASDPLA